MTVDDWRRVIDQASHLDVDAVQFIGGEPTLHPHLPNLIEYASSRALKVEVFTNLLHVSPQLWELFAGTGTSLATSYYSDVASEHEAVTGRRGSHARTTENIAEAVRRGIPLRAGVIDMGQGQRWAQAVAELAALGVMTVGTDRLRQVGRGIRDAQPGPDQLCGNCAGSVLAVTTDGTVWPCVFTRWLPVGNVLTSSLAEIVNGVAARRVRAELTEHFRGRLGSRSAAPCVPQMCNPQCGPRCGPACQPTGCAPNGCSPPPAEQCVPRYTCGPCGPKDQLCQPDRSCKPNTCRPTKR